MDKGGSLTPQEVRLLEVFRSLQEDDKRKVILAAQAVKATADRRRDPFA